MKPPMRTAIFPNRWSLRLSNAGTEALVGARSRRLIAGKT